MKDLVVWLVHTPAGTVAFLSAIAAFVYSKGSWAHRRSGRYFTVSMLIMAVSGSLAGFLKGTPNDVFLGLMVFYSVFTAASYPPLTLPTNRNVLIQHPSL